MALLLVMVGIGFVGLGIFFLAAPALMWRWQKRENELRSLESRQMP